MSSKSGKGGWKPSFGRSSSKGKDKEHSDKHGASNYQRSNSISKGGASGSRKQSSGSHDGDYSAHGKSAIPITVTSSATVSKVCIFLLCKQLSVTCESLQLVCD